LPVVERRYRYPGRLFVLGSVPLLGRDDQRATSTRHRVAAPAGLPHRQRPDVRRDPRFAGGTRFKAPQQITQAE